MNRPTLLASILGLLVACGGQRSDGPTEPDAPTRDDEPTRVLDIPFADPGPAASATIRLAPRRIGADGVAEAACPAILSELRDLYVYTEWRGVAGQHVSRVEVRTPAGHLYTMLSVPFTTEAIPFDRARWKGGPAHPARFQGPWPEWLLTGNPRPTARIESVLPVAGTHMARLSLRGTWEFAAFLDQEKAARVVKTCDLR